MISDKKHRVLVTIDKKFLTKIDEICNRTGDTNSKLINKVLASYFSDDVGFIEVLPPRELVKKQIRISLTLSEISALEIYANECGFSLSEEIIFRILATLSNEPKLTKNELNEIIKLRTSLNQIGRNVNQIAKKSSVIMREKDLLPALQNTQKLLAETDKQLNGLISKTVDRWAFISKKNG